MTESGQERPRDGLKSLIDMKGMTGWQIPTAYLPLTQMKLPSPPCGVTGLSAGEELDVDSIVKDVPKDNPKASQAVLAEAAYNAVTEEYLRVEEAIRNPSKRAEFAQPWLS